MRWPWTKPEPSPDEIDLRARVRALDDDLHALTRDFKSIQVEWDSQFSKYQALYARLAKQAKRAETRHEDAPQATNGDQPRVDAHLGTAELAGRFRR